VCEVGAGSGWGKGMLGAKGRVYGEGGGGGMMGPPVGG
jgi:hypothetical protein